MLKPIIDFNKGRIWQHIHRSGIIFFRDLIGCLSMAMPMNKLQAAAMYTLPLDITDEEKIVRVIKSPHHIKTDKKTLRPAAFRSQAGTDEVSVIRQAYMGSDFCKAKGKEIATNSYVGLAAISAFDVRATGSSLHDSRVEFYGHAHISHGVIVQPDEPQNSNLNLVLTERCRALCKAAVYHPDPKPNVQTWTGGPL
jgi:hypothetical protein